MQTKPTSIDTPENQTKSNYSLTSLMTSSDLLLLLVKVTFYYLQDPSNFLNGPLHGTEIEEHGQKEADKGEDAQRLEHEHRVERMAVIEGLGDLVCQGGLVSNGPEVEWRLIFAGKVPVQESGSVLGEVEKHFNLKKVSSDNFSCRCLKLLVLPIGSVNTIKPYWANMFVFLA